MISYAANVSQLFKSLPLAKRCERIAAAGFRSYELLFPQRESIDEVLDLQARLGLTLALFDLEVDPDAPRGNLSGPDEGRFLSRLDEAVELARKLGSSRLNALVGLKRDDLSEQAQADLIVERLARAGDQVRSEGILLLIEALNPIDNPGYFLTSSKQGVEIVRAVAQPNVKFQYDFYHMQIVEGNLIQTFRANKDYIGHVQIADVPGRHEPGTGEINYHNVLRAVEEAGYDGYVGLEYAESSPDVDPFAWLPRERRGHVP